MKFSRHLLISFFTIFLFTSFAIAAKKKKEENPWPEIIDLELEEEDIECLFHYKFKTGHIFFIQPDLRGVIYHPEMKRRVEINIKTVTEEAIEEKDVHSFKFSTSKNRFSVQFKIKSAIPKLGGVNKETKKREYVFLEKKIDQTFLQFEFILSKSKIDYISTVTSLRDISPWHRIHIKVLEHPKETSNAGEYRKKNKKALVLMHPNTKKKKPFILKVLDDAEETWTKYKKKYKANNYFNRIELYHQRSFKKLTFLNLNRKSKTDRMWYRYQTGALGHQNFNILHDIVGKNVISIPYDNGYTQYRIKKKNKKLKYRGTILIQ